MNKLYNFLTRKDWKGALEHINEFPEEAQKSWMFPDGTSHSPLYLACAARPPTELVAKLTKLAPKTASLADTGGRLPIHVGAMYRLQAAAMQALIDVAPDTASTVDSNGKVPYNYAIEFRAPAETILVLRMALPGAKTAAIIIQSRARGIITREQYSKLREERMLEEARAAEARKGKEEADAILRAEKDRKAANGESGRSQLVQNGYKENDIVAVDVAPVGDLAKPKRFVDHEAQSKSVASFVPLSPTSEKLPLTPKQPIEIGAVKSGIENGNHFESKKEAPSNSAVPSFVPSSPTPGAQKMSYSPPQVSPRSHTLKKQDRTNTSPRNSSSTLPSVPSLPSAAAEFQSALERKGIRAEKESAYTYEYTPAPQAHASSPKAPPRPSMSPHIYLSSSQSDGFVVPKSTAKRIAEEPVRPVEDFTKKELRKSSPKLSIKDRRAALQKRYSMMLLNSVDAKAGGEEDDDADIEGIWKYEEKQRATVMESPLHTLVCVEKWERVEKRAKGHTGDATLWIVSNVEGLVWKRLAVHEACKRKPTKAAIEALIAAFPECSSHMDNFKTLPLHYACAYGASKDVIECLVRAAPNARQVKDRMGKLAIDLTRDLDDKVYEDKQEILELLQKDLQSN